MSTEVMNFPSLAPGKDLDAYVQTVGAIPVLSVDEEQQLARAFRTDGDLEAARQLVLSHLRFVVHIARGYQGYGLAQGDLIQEGNVGLMKAVKRFDPEVGVRLVSFAVHWIKAEIHEYILRNWRIVKVATTKAQRKLFFNLRGAKKQLGWLTKDETKHVAEELGVSEAEVTRMEGRLAAIDMAYDGYDSDDEDSPVAPAYYLEHQDLDPAEQVIRDDEYESSTNQLGAALADLDERARDILTRRWLVDDKATLHELADEYGVSAERIRQIEKAAMKKLKGTITA